jgi:hypothetical protein
MRCKFVMSSHFLLLLFPVLQLRCSSAWCCHQGAFGPSQDQVSATMQCWHPSCHRWSACTSTTWTEHSCTNIFEKIREFCDKGAMDHMPCTKVKGRTETGSPNIDPLGHAWFGQSSHHISAMPLFSRLSPNTHAICCCYNFFLSRCSATLPPFLKPFIQLGKSVKNKFLFSKTA